MQQAASTPGTLYFLILKALARGRKRHGSESADCPPASPSPFTDVLIPQSREKNLRSSPALNSPRSEAWTLMGSIGLRESENLALLRRIRARASLLVSLACALWLLWAAPPPAAELVAPADEPFFDAYRQSDPITKWPLKKVRRQIPELKGLRPATDQSQLPVLLRHVSANLQRFVTNFVNTTALETIEETRRGGGSLNGRYVEERSVQKFRYLMLARREGNALTLIEYRTDLHGQEERPQKLTKNFIKMTGFAATELFFGPLQQPWSDFRYLGRQKIGGSPTEAVAFAEHTDPQAVMGRFSMGEASIPILVQGVAWIRTSDYQILRIRTDILAPLPPLAQVTTLVLYARNQFRDSPTALWLPREVEVKVSLGPYLFSNRHRYSDYRRFMVESVIKTDLPAAQQH